MSKLKGKAKEEFLARMQRGRAKAKRASKRNPLTGVPSKDIPRLIREGKSQKQAEAIALSEQRRRVKKTARSNPPTRNPSLTQKPNETLSGVLARASRITKVGQTAVITDQYGKVKKWQRLRLSKGQGDKWMLANPAGRRNQEPESIEAAARQFEKFHGKPPGKILEYDMQFRYPEHFAELGKLVELRIWLDQANPAFAFSRFGSCQVVSTPDGSNIYFLGGDQSIDLAALDIASDKDFVELGPCVYIAYHTVKGFHDFEPTTYWHEFGEEDGIMPVLVYDRLNKTLFLMSGNYRVRPEGIVN